MKITKPKYEKVNDNVMRITVEQINEVPLNALYTHKEMIIKKRADVQKQHEQMQKEYENMKQEFEAQDNEYVQALAQLEEAIQEAQKLGLKLIEKTEEKQ
jgi:flagellar capping protein FliD